MSTARILGASEPRILAALKLGPMTNAQLAKVLTLPRSTVGNCTRRLWREWKVRCVGHVEPRFGGGTYPRLFARIHENATVVNELGRIVK